ncbi:MAG TPA: hypothetical protein DDW87_05335 [Firmicutes bacterium]|nr:hypothetical protein [Bacillota bacterium]
MEDVCMPRLQKLPPNHRPLKETPFRHLPLGNVRPRGWLLNQLEVQAAGLTGHLDEIWPDCGLNSGWLGGTGESWERGPYYCDGLIPLAYVLDDPYLIAKAQRWVDWTLNSQQPNGQFGPKNNLDWWPRMVMLKVVANYYEATGDGRVLDFLDKYFRYQLEKLQARPLDKWGQARGAENILVIHWFYNITGHDYLLDLASLVFKQTTDWASLYTNLENAERVRGEFALLDHIVNTTMGIKTSAVFYPQSQQAEHLDAPMRCIENLMERHGQPNGVWSGDEHLNGTAPTAGTELCAVAEYMFSLQELIRVTGNPEYGDILEMVAYNAFPATFTPDMCAHQYDQQVNQAIANVAKRDWSNNGDWSNIYGLEPEFGCCTANLHQGWPKLVKSMAMNTADKGLAFHVYGPCEISAIVADDICVRVRQVTSYPFDEHLEFEFSIGQDTEFPVMFRIPKWAKGAQLRINNEESQHLSHGDYVTIERSWKDGDVVNLHLPMGIRVSEGHEGLISVYRGPLLYGLQITEKWVKVGGQEPFADWEVYPASHWNYGLILDTENPENSFTVQKGDYSRVPFDPHKAPVTLLARGRRIPGWGLINNSAGHIDQGPHHTEEAIEEIALIPYGTDYRGLGSRSANGRNGCSVQREDEGGRFQ